MHDKISINCDGGARGNPGPAAIGVVIRDDEKLEEYKERIGEATNNVAEYKALLKGLELASKYTKQEVNVFMDSELVVKQLQGLYKVKAKHLYPLFMKVKEKEKDFLKVVYVNVRREDKNQAEADRLVNCALDGG